MKEKKTKGEEKENKRKGRRKERKYKRRRRRKKRINKNMSIHRQDEGRNRCKS